MALIKEMEQQGNWLFKNRSYLPLFYYPMAVFFIYWNDRYTSLSNQTYTDIDWIMLCMGVGLLGLVVRSYTIGHTPAGTSGRNTKEGQVAEVLNSSGIYSIVRHPLYLGNYLMWLGLFLYVGDVYFVIIASMVFWVYYERIMFAEEAFLRKKFGPAYDEWASCTPAFLPDFRNFRPAKLDFSMRNVLKREYNGLFNLVLSFVLINLIHSLIRQQTFLVEDFWLVCLATALALLLVLRTLKKKTRLLHVEGR